MKPFWLSLVGKCMFVACNGAFVRNTRGCVNFLRAIKIISIRIHWFAFHFHEIPINGLLISANNYKWIINTDIFIEIIEICYRRFVIWLVHRRWLGAMKKCNAMHKWLAFHSLCYQFKIKFRICAIMTVIIRVLITVSNNFSSLCF